MRRSTRATIWSWSAAASAGLRRRGFIAAPPGLTHAFSCSTIATISAAMPSATSSPTIGGSSSAMAGASRCSLRRRFTVRWQRACCAISASTSAGSRPLSIAGFIPRSDFRAAVFFGREAFGRDALVPGDTVGPPEGDSVRERGDRRSPDAFVAAVPISEIGKEQLVALYDGSRDRLAGSSIDEKLEVLKTTSYRDYLITPLRLRRRGGELLPGPYARFFRARLRCGCGRRRARFRLSGICRPRPAGRSPIRSGASPTSIISPMAMLRSPACWCARWCPQWRPATRMDDIVLAPFDYDGLDRIGAEYRVSASMRPA